MSDFLSELSVQLDELPGAPLLSLEPSVPTTMTVAREMLEARSRGGVVGICIAEEQTQGRGRQGRTWTSGRGDGLYCSMAYRFGLKISELGTLPLATGVALCEVLRRYAPEVGLKWPNDLVLIKEDRWKLGGILVESAVEQGTVGAIIGFGINLRGEPPAPGICLEEISFRPVDYVELTVSLIKSLLNVLGELERGRSEAILSAYDQLSIIYGRKIRFERDSGVESEGIVVGVNSEGALKIESARGLELLFSGDVHLLEWR